MSAPASGTPGAAPPPAGPPPAAPPPTGSSPAGPRPAAAASGRRIAGLALPALVVLAAEPLYVLVDTAVVGHLGRVPLAALAIGGLVMTFAAWLGTVAAYGTTGRSARRFGAGDRAAAVAEGVQTSWLALASGVGLVAILQLVAGPVAAAIAGGDPAVADAAAGWLRVAALGIPGLLLAAAGNGWLRGVQDMRRPLYFVLGPNLLSAVLCPLLVYPAGMGLVGSAVANVTAQTLSGALFVGALVAERVSLRPHPRTIVEQLGLSRDLLIRGLAFQASYLSATSVAARYGAATVAAHQVAVQLYFFTALALDALAIAAQTLVGAALGAGDRIGADRLARRVTVIGGLCGLGFALLIAAGTPVVPALFTDDPQVREQVLVAWPWFISIQPVAGVVFALDGVFIGAGDVRYLRNTTVAAALGAFVPGIWLGYVLDLGLGGIWAALAVFVTARLVALLLRLRSGAWAVVGATRA